MLKVGDIGILQHLHRPSLNGQIAEVIGELKPRLLYSLTDPAQSEQCAAYAVRVPGFPSPRDRITWCVKAHQIRPLEDPDGTSASNGARKRNRRSGLETAVELPQVP